MTTTTRRRRPRRRRPTAPGRGEGPSRLVPALRSPGDPGMPSGLFGVVLVAFGLALAAPLFIHPPTSR